MGLILGGVSASDLILDGKSVSLYAGGNPPTKVWPTGPEVVQITLGPGLEAQTQFRAALSDRGLDHKTVTEIPFDIELVGTGTVYAMFYQCAALTSVPEMDTSQVTDMNAMFYNCSSLTHVPDMDTSNVTSMQSMFQRCSSLTHAPTLDTSQVTDMAYMFTGCSSLTHVPDMDTSKTTDFYAMFQNCSLLTDGNVRLSVRRPDANVLSMIATSGLTYAPFVTEIHEVSLTNVQGTNTAHTLVSATVPAGGTWNVRIQGTITKAPNYGTNQPRFRIGSSTSGGYGNGATVNYSGTITASNSTIAMVTAGTFSMGQASFTGTVTIEK